ncbi:MAG TPA: malto-oligosyltrehalose synthase [Nocardioidaceae bacterium]|nr:malto-oligosyltrehalose synthase [Nocardioidaceae bacterium]
MAATYRLQLHRGFTFGDARATVPYLADLGVTALYLSPVLQAVRGSTHGYDVADHGRINEELGGEGALRSLSEEAHGHGLSVVVDIVPNHMAFAAPENDAPLLWRLLREGQESTVGTWFDVDWEAGGGRLAVPVLGADLATEITEGSLRLDELDGEPVVRYHEHVFPVADGTLEPDDVAATLERQHYRLAHWRTTDEVLNYRRFFSVTSLIALRMEVPEAFEATHRLLLDLHREGVIDGFRVDHPDGLADPGGYLRRLAERCRPGTPIYVEKILEGEEHLPVLWPVAGTTGYDAARAVDLAFAEPASAPTLDKAWADTGGVLHLEDVVDEAKHHVVTRVLRAEVTRLTRLASQGLPRFAERDLRNAVEALLEACVVYRGYVETGPEYEAVLGDALSRAAHARPEASEVLFRLGDLARGETELGVRLQQTWSAVMAKSVEDTAFYRHHRLVALNEVGGDPSELEEAGPDVFHRWALYQQARWPAGMTTLSTHDTKRSEDVRARILAVATDPDAWLRGSAAFAGAAERLGVDGPTAHLAWQTAVGVGRVEPSRLRDYLVKAVREASLRTSWTDPDTDYENTVAALADAALHDPDLVATVDEALTANASQVRAAVLGRKALQLLAPGVPDIYQGCELVDLSLVDPDNRRPVDYDVRRARLARLAAETPQDLDDEKLLLTRTALAVRREIPEAFSERSGYTALDPICQVATSAPPVMGFVRGGRVACVVTRPGHRDGWLTERILLPAGVWRDRLTEHVVSRSPNVVACAELFERYPVAVLVRDA